MNKKITITPLQKKIVGLTILVVLLGALGYVYQDTISLVFGGRPLAEPVEEDTVFLNSIGRLPSAASADSYFDASLFNDPRLELKEFNKDVFDDGVNVGRDNPFAPPADLPLSPAPTNTQ